MANKKIQATAELFLNTKNAQKDAQVFINDLKQKLSDIESAADKMTVFKDMVEYITQVDKALASLKSTNKGAFDGIATGLDDNLKQVMELLLGISNSDIGRLDIIRNKIGEIVNSGVKTGHNDALKEIAKDINLLYRAMGSNKDIIDLDELGGFGKFEEKIKILTDAVDAFGESFSGVSDRIANSFGLDAANNISKFGQNIRAEIGKVSSEFEKIDEIRAKLTSLSNMKIKITDADDITSNLEAAQEFFSTLVELQNKIQNRGAYSSDIDYYQDYVKYIEMAKKAKKIGDTESGMDFLSKNDPAFYDAYLDAVDVAEDFAKNIKNQMLYALDIAEAAVKARIREIRNNALESLSDGSGVMMGSGEVAPKADSNKPLVQTASLYENLNQKVQEYLELRKQINATNREKDPAEYKRLIDRKNTVALEIEQLKNLDDDQLDAFYDVFEEADADGAKLNDIVEKFCNVLQIEIPRAATTASSVAESSFTKITRSANEAGQAVQNVMYHLGNLLNGRGIPRDTFGDMADNLTSTAVGTQFEKYGFGVLGGGLFGVSDPSTITQRPGAGTFIQSIDLSKYNMYMANTEERATALIDFLSKLQKFSMKSAEPDYAGFDEHLQGLDTDSLYARAKLVFDQSELTKDQFEAFINEMVEMLKQAGLAFDAQTGELSFTNLTEEIANSENISTRFMKMLGYHGVNVGGTSLDGLGQGSVLFDFDELDIVGYFNTVQEAVEDYQKILNQIGSGNWIGSKEQLQQYANNIDGIINKMTAAKDAGKLFGESGVDETLNKLIQIRQNIGDILSGKDVSGNNPFVTITTGSSESAIAMDQAKAKLESFLELTKEIHGTDFVEFGDASDNVKIGKYVERLEVAKAELDSLGDQGVLTAEQLNDVNTAFENAKTELRDATRHYDDYYGSHESYYDDYREQKDRAESAEGENSRLQRQLEIMNKLSDIDKQIALTYDHQVDQLDHLIEQRTSLLNEAINSNSIDEETLEIQRSINNELEERSKYIHDGYDKAFDDFYGELNQLSGSDLDNMGLEDIDGYLDRLSALYSKLQEAESNYLLGDDGGVFGNIQEAYDNAVISLNKAKAKFTRESGAADVSPQSSQKLSELEDTYYSDEYYSRDELEAILQDRNVLINTLKQEGAITDEILAKHEAINNEIQRRIDVMNAYDHAEITLNQLDDLYDSTDMYDLDSVTRLIETRNNMLNSISSLAFEDDNSGDFMRDEVEKAKLENSLLERRVELLKQVRQGLIGVDDVDDILQENGTLDDKLSRLGDWIYQSGLSDRPDKDGDITEALEAFEETYDRIILKLANGKKIEILPDLKGLNALAKFYDSDDGLYGPTEIEDVEFVRQEKFLKTKIESYEELCNVVERYNQLAMKGDSRTSRENVELDAILQRFRATKGVRTPDQAINDALAWNRIVDPFGRISPDDLAKYLGIQTPHAASVAEDAIEDVVSLETQKLDALQQKLLEVKTAVDAKTQAFEEERVAVDGVVDAEITSLQSLINQLQEIVAQVHLVGDAFSNINTNVPKIEVGSQAVETAASTDDTAGKIDQIARLQAMLVEVKNAVMAKTKAFADEGNVVGQVVGKEVAALNKLLETINEITPKVDALSTKMASIGPIDFVAQNSGNNVSTTESSTKTEDKFQTRVGAKKGAMTKYIDELKGVQYVTDDTIEKLVGLRDALDTVKTPKDLNNIIAKFEELQTEINISKAAFEKTGLNDIRDAERKLLGSFNTLNSDQRDSLREDRDNVIQQLKAYENAVLSGQRVEISAIENITRALREQIEAYKEANNEAKKAVASTSGNASFGSTASINATAKYNSLIRTATSDQFANSSEVADALAAYEQSYHRLLKMRDDIRTKGVIDESDKEAFKTATTECNNYAKALEKIINNSLKLKGNKANADDHMLGADFNYSDVESRKAALADFAKQMYGVDVAATDFKDNWNKVVFTVKNGDGTFTQMTATFTDARNEIVAMAGETKRSVGLMGQIWDQYKGKLKSIFSYFAASISIYDVWRVVKQGIQHVRDIDSALTELKKVTDETDASYKQFLQDMSKTGAVIGATVTDLTKSAADWARLGYTMKQAGELAKNTSILMNVSEFEDVNKATDTLISSLQAFKKEGQDVGVFSMEIIDKYNEVGNNYAISTSDLADSLTRSSAALVAANNSLEQSIALTTAANTTIQDPESVGNALKVVSMRIRGVKTELEDAGESTEGMVENTAKLQEKIMALTNIDGKGGINILTETGEFKSTYDILLAISKVWKEMDDQSQAALLELIAGKTRGSVVAALFQNGDVLENAYDSAANASGSAMNELETYLDSIQGRMDLFNNSLQTMWMNFIDSDTIKDIVDLGTAVIKLVDSIGLIPAAVGAFVGFKTAANSIKKDFKAIDDGTLSIVDVFKKKTAAMQADTVATDANTEAGNRNAASAQQQVAADQQKAQASATAAGAQRDENNAQIESEVAGEIEEAQDRENQQADLESVRVNNRVTQSQQNENNAQMQGGNNPTTPQSPSGGFMSQLISGTLTASTIKGGIASGASKLGALLLGGIKGILVGSLVSIGMDLVGNLLSPITDGIKDMFKSAEEKAKELKADVEELKNTYKEAKKEFDDNLKSLTDSGDTKLYKTLEDEFAALTKGVDKYGNNISLTSDQYERYKSICEQIVGINPKIASGYDSATKAIGNNADALSSLIELQRIQQIQNAKKLFSYQNVAKIAKDVRNDISGVKSSKKIAELMLENDGPFGSNSAYRTLADRLVFDSDYMKSFDNAEDAITSTLKTLGYTEDNIQNILSEYQSGLFDGYDSERFFADYMREIYNNVGRFNVNGNNLMLGFFKDANDNGFDMNRIFALDDEFSNIIAAADSELSNYVDGLIDYLLQVPYTRDAYYRLNDGSRSIITEWIKNSEVFKIDPNSTDTIESQFRGNIALIQKLVDAFADESIQTLVSGISDIDNSLTYSKYGETLNGIVEQIWTQIGGRDNQFGFESKNDLMQMLGFDFDKEATELAKGLQHVQNYLKTNGIEADVFRLFSADTMTKEEVNAFLGIDWNAIGAENVKNVQDVWNIIRAEISKQNSQSVQTYSALSENVSSYNEILAQTEEIVSNNTKVTQEYKDSLIELGVNEKELNECFEEGNPLVVKNADALNDLVKATKNNIAKNAQLAKSQARLQYYDLYKEITKLTKGTQVNDKTTLNYIESLYDQMGAIEKTIAKYSILEAKLLGASNAYDKLAEAQAVDEEIDYGAKAEELVNVLGDAINSRELGTEAAQAAIEGLVPETELEKLTTAEEKMDAIYSYFTTGPISQLFTIEFDDEGAITSVEMTEENLKKYINSSDVFNGAWDNFTLDPAITSMEDFMSATNMTREVAFAFLTSLEKYDISWLNGNYGTILDQLMGEDLEYKLHKKTTELSELEMKIAKNKATAEDMERYTHLQSDMNALSQQAADEATVWITTSEALENAQNRMVDLSKELEAAKAAGDKYDGRAISEIEEDLKGAQTEASDLIKILEDIGGEPTEYTIKLGLDKVQEDIKVFKETLAAQLEKDPNNTQLIKLDAVINHIETVGFENLGLKRDTDGNWVGLAKIEGYASLDEDGKKQVLQFLNYVEDEHSLEILMGEGITTIETHLENIVKILQQTYDLQIQTKVQDDEINSFIEWLNKTPFSKTVSFVADYFGFGGTNVNGTANAYGTAYKGGSWGAPETETALTGELGPELLVRGNKWSLVGEDGTEFTQVKRGDIIFNHKQTEELLKNGNITGRGKAYANGNADDDETERERIQNSLFTYHYDVSSNPIEPINIDKVDERAWFQKGVFEDGYQFGDGLRALYRSGVDAAENFVAGAVDLGEKVVDGAAMLSSGVRGWFKEQFTEIGALWNNIIGNDEKADELWEAAKNAKEEVEQATTEFVAKDLYDATQIAKDILGTKGTDYDQYSVLGEKSDALMQNAGNLAGTVALQYAGVPWWVTSGLSAMGGEAENTLKEGGTFDEALIRGYISAGAGILTEKLGGISFGGQTLTGELTKSLTENLSNKFVKKIAEFGLESVLLGEGTEEAFSEAITNFGNWVALDHDEQTLGEALFSEEAWNSYIEAYIGGFVLGEGNNVVNDVIASVNETNKQIAQNVTDALSDNSEKQLSPLQRVRAILAGDMGEIDTYTSDDIVAMHNLSVDKFRQAWQLGGFAGPSIALIRKGMQHTEFNGENGVRVTFKRSAIDPSLDPRNHVYGADANTPTVARVGYTTNQKYDINKIKAIEEQINSLAKSAIDKSGLEDTPYIQRYLNKPSAWNDGLNNRTVEIIGDNLISDARPGEFASSLAMDDKVIYAYLEANDMRIPSIHDTKNNNTYIDGATLFDYKKDAKAWLANMLQDAMIGEPEAAYGADELVAKMYQYQPSRGYSPLVAPEYTSWQQVIDNLWRIDDTANGADGAYGKRADERLQKILLSSTGNVIKRYNDIVPERIRIADSLYESGVRDIDEIIQAFNDAGEKLSNRNAYKLLDLFADADNRSVKYFESKPGRFVGFDEVADISVPSDFPADILQQMLDDGLPVTVRTSADNNRIDTDTNNISADKSSDLIDATQKLAEVTTSILTKLESELGQLNGNVDQQQNGSINYVVAGSGGDETEDIKTSWDNITGDKVTNYTVNTKYNTEGIVPHNLLLQDFPSDIGGSAHANGSLGVAQNETALTGELGPEMLVRGNKWHLVGENGAEFTQVKKGDIIFNHKQTEELLQNGHITGRGKAYANGTSKTSGSAYAYMIGATSSENEKLKKAVALKSPGGDNLDKEASTLFGSIVKGAQNVAEQVKTTAKGFVDTWKSSSELSNAYGNKGGSGSGSGSDSKDEFEETIDWIEIRLEELDEVLSKLNAELENAIGYVAKNNKIDAIIAKNREKLVDLESGADYYEKYAQKYYDQIDAKYREMAKNGAIEITDFAGDASEATVEAIQNYREYAQKSADLTQQAEEILTEIASLAKQAFDNIVDEFENITSLNDSRISQLEANNDLLETDKGFASEDIYNAIIKENEAKQKILAQQRDALQAELDSGKIKEYSADWYDAVNAIAEVDAEIINLRTDNENLQDSINELNWEQFEFLIAQFQVVSDEAENLLDILGTKDTVDEFGEWTDDGIASLGLLAQKMEVAEKQASKYENAIKYLNENWEELGYTQQEYVERLDELKSGQYDAIKSYHDSKDAIVELNKARVDAIKEGIEKEVEAYEELIDKQKEALDSEKDLYDFQRSTMDKQKNIADIERKLAALSSDNSASARAQRAKLEAELYEAKADLEDSYYDRSISNQQDALDKELESFQKQKDEEIEGWEKYLENIELVVSDSLAVVQANTSAVLATLQVMQEQYGLTVTNTLMRPWQAGESAIQEYGAKLNISLATLASMLGMTVDQMAAKLGITTTELVGNLNITVAQLAGTLGLTNEEMAAKLGTTVANINGMMNMTIQQLAANLGITLPILAEKLGTTTAGLAGNLDMTMAQFAGKMGLTVEDLASKFGFSTESLADKLGMTYQDLMNPFGLSMSATVDALKKLETDYSNILAGITGDSKIAVDEVNKAMDRYQVKEPTKPVEPAKPEAPQKQPQEIVVGGKINAGNAKIYADSYGGGGGKQYYASDPNYIVLSERNGFVLVRHHKLQSGYTGWFKKSELPKFASGTLGTKQDGLAWIDELGEELIMHADGSGKLAFLSKGTAVVPHDISENLMRLGQLDPSVVLDQNRPQIAPSKSIINTEVRLDCSVGTLVNIEHCDQNTLPDVEKLVNKAFDKHMQTLNNSLKKFTR